VTSLSVLKSESADLLFVASESSSVSVYSVPSDSKETERICEWDSKSGKVWDLAAHPSSSKLLVLCDSKILLWTLDTSQKPSIKAESVFEYSVEG
jgi:WD40 repeat protein